MSDINLNLGNIMPLPDPALLGGAQEAQASAPASSLYAGDSLATTESAQIARILVNLESDNPAPVGANMSALNNAGNPEVAGRTGMGNPWLAANPTVAFTLAYLDMFRALREAKAQTGESMVTQIGLTTDLAKSAAKLAISSAEKESTEHIINAVMAGVQMGVSIAGAAIGFAAAMKAAKSSPDMDEAKADLKTAKEPRVAAEKTQTELQTKQAGIQADIEANNAKIDSTPDDVVGTDGKMTTTKSGLTDKKAELEAKMADVKKDIETNKADLKNIDKNINAKQTTFQNAETRHLQQFQRLTAILQPLLDAIGKGTEMIGTFYKAGLSIEKGAIESQKQLVQGAQEVMRRLGETKSEAWRTDSEAINSLIQGLKQMEDAMARAMSMTRN